MVLVTAQLNNYRQSPRKARLVADLVRGKGVSEAGTILSFAAMRGGDAIKKLLDSAVANAKNLNIDTAKLAIKEISVNGGTIMYRRRPMSRGRPFPIRKRTSNISIVLDTKQENVKRKT